MPVTAQTDPVQVVRERFPEGVREVKDCWGVPALVVDRADLASVARFLREEPSLRFDYLSDIVGLDFPRRNPRFELTYNLYSIPHRHRLFLKVPVPEGDAAAPTVTGVWKSAGWPEREVYDLFGVTFRDHPDLRRILTPDWWKGHPLRKDYPLGGEEVAFTFNKDEILEQEPLWKEGVGRTDYASFLGGEISEVEKGKMMVLNMGPQHPSTHGVLRLVVELHGEIVTKVIPHIGYLHTGIEKTAESLSWLQAITVTDRMDYLNPPGNNLGYVLAVEKLLGLKAPPRAQAIRVIIAELTRIASHVAWLSFQALDLGAISVFFYCFREREKILDLMEMASGVRMMTSYITIGGVRKDLPEGFLTKTKALMDELPDRLAEYEALLTENKIWLERTRGIGIIGQVEAIAWALSGPTLRGSGVAWDLRKAHPYCGYDTYDFDIAVEREGDVYARYLVRLEEIRQSRRIIYQAMERLPDGPSITEDRKLALPPRGELDKSMEAVIHQFLIASGGFPVPNGEAYVCVESPRGELGFYLVSDGGNRPYRMKVRAPSYIHLQALPAMAEGGMVADLVAVVGSVDPVMGEVDR
ncbi:MAG: NADH-quinone oxidoreductase subunit D [Nitrospirae bacterium]|nr:NADH-quinone oxidoreductase subunit D [Nitrospirota bacterium]